MLTNASQLILNNSIYQIETQCEYSNIPNHVIENESERLKSTLKKYNYPKKYRDEVLKEFRDYFN